MSMNDDNFSKFEHFVNGDVTDAVLELMGIGGTNTTVILCPVDKYVKLTAATATIAWKMNMRSLVSAEVPAESARKIASYRTAMLMGGLYPTDSDESGTGTLEVQYKSEAALSEEAPTADMMTIAASDCRLGMAVAFLFRKQFVHLWQDNSGHAELYTKLQTALRATMPHALSLTGPELRMVYHACGFKFLKDKISPEIPLLPKALSLRLSTLPAGARKYETLATAAMTAASNLALPPKVTAFVANSARAVVEQAKRYEWELSQAASFWGVNTIDDFGMNTQVSFLAALAMGWVNSQSAGTSWAGAMSLKQLSTADPNQVATWEHIFSGINKSVKKDWKAGLAAIYKALTGEDLEMPKEEVGKGNAKE